VSSSVAPPSGDPRSEGRSGGAPRSEGRSGLDAATPPGWYPDPWQVGSHRWWDGRTWTPHYTPKPGDVAGPAPHQPGLPSWLSVPVLVAGGLVVPGTAILAVGDPEIIPLVLVPLLFIVPVLLWADRLEPEPRPARLHAFLWGATTAIAVASIANATVAVSISESAAAVASAPLVEELMKGLAILVAIRRHEVDGPVDGLVYAGWVAAGFATVENVEYFLIASDSGVLAETFAVRAIATPFAHPLFTAWTGLALGLAVARGRPLVSAWWGLAVAIGLHAAWNGSLVATGDSGDLTLFTVAAIAFVGVFVAAAALVITIRRRERHDYFEAIPFLVATYGLTAAEVTAFGSWKELLTARRQLSKSDRGCFDDLHAALARLAAFHARQAATGAADEARLVQQLTTARTALR
jgi:RsiW-degrading membrane proteinase PrsW (M82 family)